MIKIKYSVYLLFLFTCRICFSIEPVSTEQETPLAAPVHVHEPEMVHLILTPPPSAVSLEASSSQLPSHSTQETPMNQLISLIETLRERVIEQTIDDVDAFVEWVEQEVEPRVRGYVEDHPLIRQRLDMNRRIELRLDSETELEGEAPILMIIDSWGHQTSVEAILSAILYPSSVPMLGDECDHENKKHMIRLALCAYYRNPLAYYHLALWAHHRRSEAFGLSEGRSEFPQSRLFRTALQQFEISHSDAASDRYTDFQRRCFVLCMRDLKPETTKRAPITCTEDPLEQDPRLLFNMGISGNKHKEKLVQSKERGLLVARFHQTRRLEKQERIKELQKMKRDLSILERRSHMRHIGDDLITHMDHEIDKEMVRVGVHQNRNGSDSTRIITKDGFDSIQTKEISRQILKIITKTK